MEDQNLRLCSIVKAFAKYKSKGRELKMKYLYGEPTAAILNEAQIYVRYFDATYDNMQGRKW